MTPTLIGYFVKQTERRAELVKALKVEELCSVSCCISKAPEGWIQRWLHNELWLYDSEELAWRVLPEAQEAEDFELYAYRLFPLRYVDGQEQSLQIPTLKVQPLSASYERLGLDVVNRSQNNQFGCSPLSCNGRAIDFTVNRHCLLDELKAARGLATLFSSGTHAAEPGPYHVVEVFRERQTK